MKSNVLLKQTICDEISIDSSLNVTDQLKKENQDDFNEHLQHPNHKNQQYREAKMSKELDNIIKDNSYSIINQTDEDLLNQVDQIFEVNTSNINQVTIKRLTQKIDNHYGKQSKMEKNENKTTTIIQPPTDLQIKTLKKVVLNQQSHDASLIQFENQLEDLEKIVKNYRNDLKQYQQQIMQKAEDEKQRLISSIDNLTQKLQQSQTQTTLKDAQINDLLNKNTSLIYSNSHLRNQIANLKHPQPTTKSRISHSLLSSKIKQPKDKQSPKVYHGLNKTPLLMQQEAQYFTETIRRQLQTMIESLLVEVQYLRKANQKLKKQIKDLNVQIISAEKTIKVKNQKIHNLELIVINNKKQLIAPQLPTKISRLMKNHEINSSQVKDIFHEIPYSEFSLADVINNKKAVTSIERRIISLKIIECYQEKISQKDFEMLMAEDLIVSFKSHEIKDIQITTSSNKSYENSFYRLTLQEKEALIGKLLWNMSFILDELFRASKTDQGCFVNEADTIQQDIKILIEELLETTSNTSKISHTKELKDLIQQSIQLSFHD